MAINTIFNSSGDLTKHGKILIIVGAILGVLLVILAGWGAWAFWKRRRGQSRGESGIKARIKKTRVPEQQVHIEFLFRESAKLDGATSVREDKFKSATAPITKVNEMERVTTS